MPRTNRHGIIDVCSDCYTAHHYGAHEHEGRWYAGESDEPADREPLGDIDPALHVADATDSETEEGMTTFSAARCEGCSSLLAGARYALALWATDPA